MFKKMSKSVSVVLLALLLCALTACGQSGKSTDFSKVLSEEGTWVTFHWYFNENGGDSGNFTDDSYYTWTFNEDNTFTVTAQDGSFDGEGTIEWTSENQADVYLVYQGSEQYWTGEFSYSTSHPDFVNFMIQETNFVYVLEPTE